MKTLEISGVTVSVKDEGKCPVHITQKFGTMEDAVNYMKENDVIHKGIRMGDSLLTLEIEKTAQAIDNANENDMRIDQNDLSTELPTNMYK